MFVFSEVSLSRMKVVRVILWYYIYNTEKCNCKQGCDPSVGNELWSGYLLSKAVIVKPIHSANTSSLWSRPSWRGGALSNNLDNVVQPDGLMDVLNSQLPFTLASHSSQTR
jgi:hypothetical protein